MPSKIQLDENLWFLYICLQNSDMKSIDFTSVAAKTSLKPPAARMRYTRLKRQIESGTLIGTKGIAFTPSKEKRKRELKDEDSETKVKVKVKVEGGMGVKHEMDDEEEDLIPLAKSRRRVTVKTEVGEESAGGKGKVHLTPDAQLLSWEMGMNPDFVRSDAFAGCA